MLKNPGSTLPPRRLRAAAWLARIALWLVVLAWGLFALSWGVLHAVIVPRVGEWRPALESVATRALGVPVRVGAVQAVASGPIPAFELRDVRLFDARGREALHLPRIQAALSVRSLWRLGFEQLLIDGAVLAVRRTAAGRIEIGGIDVSPDPNRNSGRVADWFFGQREFAIRHGTLRWTDETRPDLPPLQLDRVDAVFRNPGRQHHWRLDATPPSAMGQRFSLRGRFQQPVWQTRAGAWRDWSGTAYAEAPLFDLQPLAPYLDLAAWTAVAEPQGQGAWRAWAMAERGRLTDVSADVALHGVAWRGRTDGAPLALQNLRGRFNWQGDRARTRLSTEGLAFTTADGLVWPGGDLAYAQTRGPDGALREWEAEASRFDLAVLAPLAPWLPLPDGDLPALAALQPQGQAEALQLRWAQGAHPGDAPRWSASGRVRGLALQAAAVPAPQARQDGRLDHPLARPGVRGADVDFTLDQDGGRGQLRLQDGALTFPGLFADPELPLRQLSTDVTWRRNGEQIEVELPQLRFANADAEGEGRVRWRTADPATSPARSRFPGVIDLDVQMARADGARVHRYLPQAIPESVRHYLREAVAQAQARDVRFQVSGDLWDFPYADPRLGRFEVRGQLQQVALAYVPEHLRPAGSAPWPALDQVQAALHIDRVALHIAGASGGVQGAAQLRAVQTEARIADFTADDPVLQVRGTVQGPGAEALDFVRRSPLGPLLDGVLDQAQLDGPVGLGLGLELPLNRPESVRVNGQLRLNGNDLRIAPEAPWLRAASGTLDFTEQGFRVSQASARLLGGELRFSGAMERQGGQTTVRFQGQGSVSADGLRRAGDMGGPWAALATLGQHSSGSTTYQARLAFTPDGSHVRVESGLQGLALALPAPMDKAAPTLLPLLYEVTPLPGAAPWPEDVRRDRWVLELGAGPVPLLSARYDREHGSAGTRVLRGALALRSERPPLPERGVQGQFVLGDFDLQAWQDLVAAVPASAGTAESPDTLDPAYWPTAFGLSADHIRQGGRQFHDVVAGGSRDGQTWRVSVGARELNGYVEYRPNQGQVPGRVYARLARLTLPPASASEVENLLQAQPRTIPAVDAVVDDLELNGRRLGRLEIQAINRNANLAAQESGREWRLNTLNLTVPEARLQASGNWAALGGGAQRRTALKVNLAIDDAGALLARFGMPDVVRGGKGTLAGSLGWIGSPLGWDVPSLSGDLQLDLQRGQFLKAEPGLAKLLGVLSLQALPRRLVLDFRDVFSEGFAFDFVRGNAQIAQGVASTNNLQMKGVSAAVLLEGRADIAHETQDITAVVIPELNAGTASLVATVISPVTGLGSFLAQYLLRQPLQEAATQQYRIRGSWTDPQVEKLERSNRRNIDPEQGADPRPGGTP